MNKRMCMLIFCIIFLLCNVLAQGEISGIENLENDSIVKGVKNLQEFSEEKKWENIGSEWKEILLNNGAVSMIDGFFRKIDIVFVIVFARSYDLSLELFFAIVIWAITFFAIRKYLVFLRKSNKNFLQVTSKSFLPVALTIVLAHAQIFNYISKGLFKLMFYKAEWWWSILSFVVILVGFYIYYFINKYFSGIIKSNMEKKEKEKEKLNVEKIETIVKKIT